MDRVTSGVESRGDSSRDRGGEGPTRVRRDRRLTVFRDRTVRDREALLKRPEQVVRELDVDRVQLLRK